MSRISAVVAFVFAAVAAFAQDTVQVLPSAPTTAIYPQFAITHTACHAYSSQVGRSGSIITLTYTEQPCVLAPPVVTTPISSRLPAGTYTVQLVDATNPASPAVANANAATFTVTQAYATGVQVTPAAPTSVDTIAIAVTHLACPPLASVQSNGNFVDIISTVDALCHTPNPATVTTTFQIGLGAGTYTIRFLDRSTQGIIDVVNANAGTITVVPGTTDTVQILPPAPTTAGDVRVAVTHSNCIQYDSVTRNGSMIDVLGTYVPCIPFDDITTTLAVGTLPAGTYTLRLLNRNGPGDPPYVVDPEAATFVVAESHGPAHIPALDEKGMLALIVAIAIAAFIVLRRAAL